MKRHWQMLKNRELADRPEMHLDEKLVQKPTFNEKSLSHKDRLAYLCILIENLSFSEEEPSSEDKNEIRTFAKEVLDNCSSSEHRETALAQMLFSGRRSERVKRMLLELKTKCRK